MAIALQLSLSLLNLHGYVSPLSSYPRRFDTRSIQIPTSQRCNGVNPQASSTFRQFRPFFHPITCPPTFRKYFSADANTFHCLRFTPGPIFCHCAQLLICQHLEAHLAANTCFRALSLYFHLVFGPGRIA